jgi:peptide/nickel transport system permease protein
VSAIEPQLLSPLPTVEAVGEDDHPVSAFRRFQTRFRRQHLAVAALGILVALTLLAILIPLLPVQDPQHQSLIGSLQPPSRDHLLGTDQFGRDLFSRMLWGSRVSLFATFEATAIAFALAIPLGIAAGLLGGWIDLVLSRVADAFLSFPFLVMAIAVVGILGGGVATAMVAVGILFAPGLYRIVRAAVLQVREETFIEAAFAMGCSKLRIGARHVLPNVLPPLIVQASILMGYGLLAEASLSFLGLGISPDEISWGSMVGSEFSYLRQAPLPVLLPGAAIVLCVLSFNVFGDGLRDALGRPGRRG